MQRLQEPDRQPQPDTSKFHTLSRPDAAPVKGARRTVLWVSGDAGQAMDCAAFLQGIGFDVVPVKSVPMGAARLAELAPLWSAIVLDADSIGADIATGNLHRFRRLAPQVPARRRHCVNLASTSRTSGLVTAPTPAPVARAAVISGSPNKASSSTPAARTPPTLRARASGRGCSHYWQNARRELSRCRVWWWW